MEFIKAVIDRIRFDLGIEVNPTGGRSADAVRRIANIMGTTIVHESPAEEYARLAKLAKPMSKKRTRTKRVD